MTVARGPWRIGMLEDSGPVREHFLDIIQGADDLVLAGVATCMAESETLLETQPDLVLTDLGLPDGSGLDFIPRLKAIGGRALVITALATGARCWRPWARGPTAIC